MAILNPRLIKENNVSLENQEKLLIAYQELNEIMERAKQADSDEECKVIVVELEQLEFTLQLLWNFSEDSNFHSYWNRLSGCECPKLDNQECFGHHRIINMSCKFHGNN